MIPWRGIGIAVGASIAAATASVVAHNRTAGQEAASVIAIREDLREFRKESNERLDKLTVGLSTLQGYIAGKEARK